MATETKSRSNPFAAPSLNGAPVTGQQQALVPAEGQFDLQVQQSQVMHRLLQNQIELQRQMTMAQPEMVEIQMGAGLFHQLTPLLNCPGITGDALGIAEELADIVRDTGRHVAEYETTIELCVEEE